MRTASATYASFPAIERRDQPFAGRGWGAYLLWVALLTPFAIPGTVGQLAFVDLLNAVAGAAFFATVVARGLPVTLPFALPLLLIGAGTLLSLTGALSLSASALAIAQDFYLYLWLVVLVAVIAHRPGASETVARAWIVSALVIAALCFTEAIRARGLPGLWSLDEELRTRGAFYNPNMCADFLVLSLFVLLSLGRSIRLRWFVLTAAALALALLTTKSNGGLFSLAAGALAAFAAWAWSGTRGRARRLGLVAATAGIMIVSLWVLDEARVTGSVLSVVGEKSFVGRLEKSTSSRQTIWGALESRLSGHPLGIGPGNSSLQPVNIGQRVRKDSFQSKEAHSDYVAYLVERGPIGFVGLLLATVQALVLVWFAAKRARASGADERVLALWTAACIGGLVASGVHSLVIEKLHFRHFWLFLAWVVASAAWWAAYRATPSTRSAVEV